MITNVLNSLSPILSDHNKSRNESLVYMDAVYMYAVSVLFLMTKTTKILKN